MLSGPSRRSTLPASAPSDSDFQRLHDCWYRRSQLCEMRWPDAPTALHGCLIAARANGGPIAAVRDVRVFQASRGAATSDLQIFTAGGLLISSCPWTYNDVVTMHWTSDELLVCVFKNAVVRVFSVFGEALHCYHMDPRLRKENGVLSALVAPEGVIVVLTGTLKLFANLSLTQSHCIRLADVPITSPPYCIRTIPTTRSHVHRNVDSSLQTSDVSSNPDFYSKTTISSSSFSDFAVLVASEQGPLYLVDQVRSTQLPVVDGPFSVLCVSPTGRNVACMSQGGDLQVFSTTSDFSSPLDKAGGLLNCGSMGVL